MKVGAETQMPSRSVRAACVRANFAGPRVIRFAGVGLSAVVLLLAGLIHPSAVRAAEQGSARSSVKPRYTMPSGRGWSVCESYLRTLNATPAEEGPPLCDLKLDRVPGIQKPEWEVLEVHQHLPIVHQIELILGKGSIEPEPDKDFDRWKQQFDLRKSAQSQRPALRRTRMPLTASGKRNLFDAETGKWTSFAGGQIETLLAYDFDAGKCEKEVGKARKGLPHDGVLGVPKFFVFDEPRQRVMGTSRRWNIRMQGEPFLYAKKPYFVRLFIGGDNLDQAGHIYIKRIEPLPPNLARRSADDPPYIDREICRIRFADPFPPVRQ